MRVLKLMISTSTVLQSFILVLLPAISKGQGNGNPIALRTSPYDAIFPIPHNDPPSYIKERIYNFVDYFFSNPEDQAEAESILMTIWYYNSIYAMLSLVDRMKRNQYAYADFGDECVGDAEDDVKMALDIQIEIEGTMHKPGFISAQDSFFKMDAWWEIVENTVDNIWTKNQLIASKICDFRRRGLMCIKNSNNELRCRCAKDGYGERMQGVKGGLCAIEKGKKCNFTSSSRLMTHVYDMEVYNSISDKHIAYQTCFGNSFCSVDQDDKKKKTCACWPLITAETRSKRQVILNYTVEGNRCDQYNEPHILKWGKWYVALTIVWLAFPLVLIFAPHWDDICIRIVPGYYKHLMLGDRSQGKPKKLPLETYDVKMSDEMKKFIEENAETVDVDDEDYFDKVGAVDERDDIDPFDRFIAVPQCTDKHYHFEWPEVDKLRVWF